MSWQLFVSICCKAVWENCLDKGITVCNKALQKRRAASRQNCKLLQELRVRGSYLHHKEVKAAQGIKIAAQNLENAVAGTQMLVVQKGDSIEDLKEEVMGDMTDIFKSVDKSGQQSQ